MRGLALFRTILFLPQVIALVVVGGDLADDLRPDGAQRFLGGRDRRAVWLGDFSLALPAVGLIGTWVFFGLAMVLLMAGVQKIPHVAL